MKEFTKITTEQDLKLVFDKYFKPLVSFANNYIFQLGDCEDIVQDVFIVLWKEKPSFASQVALRSYLYKITKNKCLNKLKHEKVKEKYIQNVIQLIVNDDFYEEKVIKEEITRNLYEAIGTLSKRKQQIIKLALKGLKNTEITERLLIKIQTVKTLKSQAYKALRDYFNNKNLR